MCTTYTIQHRNINVEIQTFSTRRMSFSCLLEEAVHASSTGFATLRRDSSQACRPRPLLICRRSVLIPQRRSNLRLHGQRQLGHHIRIHLADRRTSSDATRCYAAHDVAKHVLPIHPLHPDSYTLTVV